MADDSNAVKVNPGLVAEKTKVVYCKDTNRKGDTAIIQFDFLGYSFRPRLAKWRRGLYGVSFLPAASPRALKAIRQAIRRWALHIRRDTKLDDLARFPYRGSAGSLNVLVSGFALR